MAFDTKVILLLDHADRSHDLLTSSMWRVKVIPLASSSNQKMLLERGFGVSF